MSHGCCNHDRDHGRDRNQFRKKFRDRDRNRDYIAHDGDRDRNQTARDRNVIVTKNRDHAQLYC